MENQNNTLTFWKLISQYTIVIPIIQRDYAQGRKTEAVLEIRKNFLDSLADCLEQERTLDLDFVYGSVRENDIFVPLDGQQRLTTLFLLHWYAALKEGKLEQAANVLKKFSYETRASAKEFCHALTGHSETFHGIAVNTISSLTDTLRDAPWFFFSWKHDPTIQAMLTMIDSIHEKFKDSDYDLWPRLLREDPALITFQFLPLDHFGLDDSLYIKMNARGKPLTSFENFKASLQNLMLGWEQQGKFLTGYADQFISNTDNQWVDLFWNYRKKKRGTTDEEFMCFINYLLSIYYAASTVENNPTAKDFFMSMREKEQSFFRMQKNGVLTSTSIEFLSNVLARIATGNEAVAQYLPDSKWVDEEDLFQKAIINHNGFAERLLCYSLYSYLQEHPAGEIDAQLFDGWMRIAHNLIVNVFYDRDAFFSAIQSISSHLLPFCDDITRYVADESNHLGSFSKDQIEEERIKAFLILRSDVWSKAIQGAEQHPYFKGQISFLLDYSGILQDWRNKTMPTWNQEEENARYNLFSEYSRKASMLFDAEGVAVNIGLWRRTLLCHGDYLLSKKNNYSFVIDGTDRDISWKRLFRDEEKRQYVKLLLDIVPDTQNVADIEKSLRSFIEASVKKLDDWRYYFVEYPEMIDKGCGTQKYIRYIAEDNIFMLSGERLSGYCNEYLSYALHLEIERRKKAKTRVIYHKEYGLGVYRYVELNMSNTNHLEIAYDADGSKWIYGKDLNKAKNMCDSFDEMLDILHGKGYIE